MQRQCDSCGRVYEAQRRTSRFCGGTCRVRAGRGAVRPSPSPRVAEVKPSAVAGVSAVDAAAPSPPGVLEEAVRRRLVAVDRSESALGVAALAVAARLDAGGDTGSGVAALTRELRATLAAASEGIDSRTSSVVRHRDELAARRRA